MTETFVYSIDEIIKWLEAAKNDGYKGVLMCPGIHGMVYAPSQKTDLYRVPVAIDGGLWKTKSLGNLGLNNIENGNKFVPIVLIHKSKEDQLIDGVVRMINGKDQ